MDLQKEIADFHKSQEIQIENQIGRKLDQLNEILIKGELTSDMCDKLEQFDLVKGGKRAQVGEIREWSGKKYRKESQGWVPVKEENKDNRNSSKGEQDSVQIMTDEYYQKLGKPELQKHLNSLREQRSKFNNKNTIGMFNKFDKKIKFIEGLLNNNKGEDTKLQNLRKEKDELISKFDELVKLKKKLYPNPDITSPMSKEEKELNNKISQMGSLMDQKVREIRKIKDNK